jgi:hypothetical protein
MKYTKPTKHFTKYLKLIWKLIKIRVAEDKILEEMDIEYDLMSPDERKLFEHREVKK